MHGLLLPGLLATMLLGSCSSSPYTPSPDRPFEEIPEFTTQSVITITNAQPDVEQLEIGGRMLANLNEWTEVAIVIADRELQKRGATIEAGAGKSLSMALTRAEYIVGWVTIETQIDMRVATGDGYSASYTSRNSSAMFANPPRQVDGAVMRVVKEMLIDPQVVAYLTN